MSDEIKIDDDFEIKVRVTTHEEDSSVHRKWGVAIPCNANGPWHLDIPEQCLLSGRRLPRQIKVGDRVRTNIAHMWPDWTVVAIDGDHAACVGTPYSDAKCRNWWPLSDLTLDDKA